MKIILLNGPRRVGKDVCGAYIASTFGAMEVKFAYPLKRAIPYLFGIPYEEWDELYETNKETPHPNLQGMTPREAMIWVSEDVLKTKFGKSYMGVLAARHITNHYDPDGIYVFTDSRFCEEIEILREVFGPECINLIRIERPETSFAGDTGKYIAPEDIGIPEENFYIAENNGTLPELYNQLDNIMGMIIE